MITEIVAAIAIKTNKQIQKANFPFDSFINDIF